MNNFNDKSIDGLPKALSEEQKAELVREFRQELPEDIKEQYADSVPDELLVKIMTAGQQEETDPEFKWPLGDAWGPFTNGVPWDDGRPPALSDWRRGRLGWMISRYDEAQTTAAVIADYVSHVKSVQEKYIRPNFQIEFLNEDLRDWIPVFEALGNCPVTLAIEDCIGIADNRVLATLTYAVQVAFEGTNGIDAMGFENVSKTNPNWCSLILEGFRFAPGELLNTISRFPRLEMLTLQSCKFHAPDVDELRRVTGGRLLFELY